MLKRALFRFLRGGLSGAITAMLLIVPMNTSSWSDLRFWLEALILAGTFGFITGFLLAFDKYLRDFKSK